MTTNNILRWVIFIGLFAVPFIPFIITQSLLFPFITGKGFAFRILVEIIFASWLLLALRDSQYRPKWDWIAKSLLVFLGVLLLADIFSKYPYKSIWSNYERMEGFVLIAHLVAFYFVLTSFMKTTKLWRWFWNIELGAGVIMSIYGFLQLAGKIAVDQGGVRLDATFGNSSYLAIYLVFNLFIALMLFFSDQENSQANKMWKWIYAAAFVIQLIPLYYTATRGSIGGFIGGLIVAALLVAFKERNNMLARKIAYWLLGGVAVLIIVFVAVRNTPFVQKNDVLSRFSQLSVNDLESQGRAYVWPMAIKGFVQSPKTFIIGWGQESFNYVFNQYYNPAMYNQEQWFDRTHNIVLDWLINAGILGLLAYLSIFVALLYTVWKKSDFSIESKALITGLMAAYFFNNFFVFDNIASYILFFAVLAWVSSRSMDAFPTAMPIAKQFSPETLNYFAAPVIAIVLVATVYFVNVPAILASHELIQALSSQSSLETNLSYFKEAFARNSFGTPEVLEQLAQAAIQVIGTQSADATTKQDFYNLTDQQLKAQIAHTPEDARYLLLAGSFYDRAGQYDTAIPYLQSAIKYSPNKPTMYFELATSYLGKSNPDQAFKLFTQGYNLATSSSDGQIIYAIGALYDKQGTIVQQMFQTIGENTVISDNRIFQAYLNMSDYTSAAAILTLRLQKNPSDYQSELQLASIYAQVGQNSKAIQLIQDVEKKNPSAKSQLDPYIQQLQSGSQTTTTK